MVMRNPNDTIKLINPNSPPIMIDISANVFRSSGITAFLYAIIPNIRPKIGINGMKNSRLKMNANIDKPLAITYTSFSTFSHNKRIYQWRHLLM